MNWAEVKKLGLQIRRSAWTNWLVRKNNVWWIYGTDGSFRVAQNGDVTAQDLLAGDWTIQAADSTTPAAFSFPPVVKYPETAVGTPAIAPTNVPATYIVEKWMGFATNDPSATGPFFYLSTRQIIKLPAVTWDVWVGGGCQFNYYGPYLTQFFWRENFTLWRKSAVPYVVGGDFQLPALTVGPVSQCAGVNPNETLSASMASVGPNGSSVFIG